MATRLEKDYFMKRSKEKNSLSTIDEMIKNLLSGTGKEYADELVIDIVKAYTYQKLLPFYDDCEVFVLPEIELSKMFHMSNVKGITCYKTIFLSRDSALNLKNGQMDIINTINHEVNHVYHSYLIDHDDISYQTYSLIVDQILVVEFGSRYRNLNYWHLFEEILARLDAEVTTYLYVHKICPTKAKSLLEKLQTTIKQSQEEFQFLTRQLGHKYYDRESLLDRAIKRNPVYLSYYPILNFYYYPSGQKRSIGNILMRQQFCDDFDKKLSKVIQLDKVLLFKRNGNWKNLKQDLASLYDDSILHMCLDNDQILHQREKLIFLLRERLNRHKSGNNISDLIDEFQDRLNNLKKIVYNNVLIIKNFPTSIYCYLTTYEPMFYMHLSEMKNKFKIKK